MIINGVRVVNPFRAHPAVMRAVKRMEQCHRPTTETKKVAVISLAIFPEEVGGFSAQAAGLNISSHDNILNQNLWPCGVRLPWEVLQQRNSDGNRYAMCHEFSLLFVSFARQFGLEAGIIWRGQHSYNFVIADGQEIRIDCASYKNSLVSELPSDGKLTELEIIASYYWNTGAILIEQNRAELAIAPLQKGLKLQPESALAHFHLGIAYQKLGQRQSAFKHLGLAKKFDPDIRIL